MTAIEWLIEQCPRINTIASIEVIEQAKQIEISLQKEQYEEGWSDYHEELNS